jgi:hypothetical protein
LPQEGDIYLLDGDGSKVAVSGIYGSMSRVRDLSYEGPDFNIPTGVLAGIRPSGTLLRMTSQGRGTSGMYDPTATEAGEDGGQPQEIHDGCSGPGCPFCSGEDCT